MQRSATCLWWHQVYPVRLMMAGIVQATVETTTGTGHWMDFSLSATRVLYRCIITATRDGIGAIAFFFPVNIKLQETMRIPWMLSRQANIFVCTIRSRPGLFVPTLFVMHDVSLTPTKKVA
ncbi:hypothetical protein K492DRAFT_200699 [Lichtheimia hyalospora FSU 10163]|nr:hypothetical protein K492DRAFT_200699 [Lichtheimia hyalospora FSU 10163]